MRFSKSANKGTLLVTHRSGKVITQISSRSVRHYIDKACPMYRVSSASRKIPMTKSQKLSPWVLYNAMYITYGKGSVLYSTRMGTPDIGYAVRSFSCDAAMGFPIVGTHCARRKLHSCIYVDIGYRRQTPRELFNILLRRV